RDRPAGDLQGRRHLAVHGRRQGRRNLGRARRVRAAAAAGRDPEITTSILHEPIHSWGEQPMAKAPNTPLGKMYHAHIKMILEKEIEGLLNQYTDDALLISSFEKKPLYFRGRQELREHFKGILGIQGMKVDIAFWAETENPQTLMIVEAIKMLTPAGEASMRFADSWVLRDGKIAIHFAGMVQHADGSLA